MVEHVGKKRRKQVREAINMKQEMKKRLLTCIIVLCIALVMIGLFSFLSISGFLLMEKGIYSVISLMLVLCLALVLGKQSQKFFRSRTEYKTLIQELNITKEDMQKLEEGLL